ncbi:MAG: uroporphyrinogen decarboxylase [Oscillospiraceae bacterium]|nr:uroporphyrinogen decarboxylase [Oscillospiraceae bacterium]
MTRRELVIAALEHRESPIVPWSMDFTQQAADNLVRYTGDPDITKKLEGCILSAYYDGWPVEIPGRREYFKDDFGVVWNRTGVDKEIGVVDSYLIEDLEDTDYELPAIDEVRLRAAFEKVQAEKGDRFTFASIGFSMYERAWSLMGMENTLTNMILCPDELEELLDRICEFNMKIVDIALEYDFDGIHFGDDWGQQHGLIMGPHHWRRFIKPRMARLYKRVKDAGKFVSQHSCGDCHEIFPDLIEIGLDCYQTFQPEIYDIAKMKELYGDKLTFWGGVSTQRCLPYATPEGVKEECQRIMGILRKNGGLIIAPTHSLAFDVPAENILAMAEVFQHQ